MEERIARIRIMFRRDHDWDTGCERRQSAPKVSTKQVRMHHGWTLQTEQVEEVKKGTDPNPVTTM
jgi:hypothetical protein